MRCIILFICFLHFGIKSQELSLTIKGRVITHDMVPLEIATVALKNTSYSTLSQSNGLFELKRIPPGTYTLVVALFGYLTHELKIDLTNKSQFYSIKLTAGKIELEEIVVTGTMRETSKSESPVNIDIISPKLLQKTAVPNLFEATALVNGVRPQINCNVCNTGDIHINGMEGPYTLILIDGMPIVSGLSSVYGLMGIPTGIMERLEIAKGPAGALYGSEAMGGTINLITKNAGSAPNLFIDYYGTSHFENNLELSAKIKLGRKANWLLGANGFYFDKKLDKNNDGFTDVTLQKRISIFNKINFNREEQREFSVALRYVYEDRWGGQSNWSKQHRGGDSLYGESIYISRSELISKYQWPLKEKIFTQLSYNFHDQNSMYGIQPFLAKQSTAFMQTYWTKNVSSRNDVLLGLTYKNLWFDDNTAATKAVGGESNKPDLTNTYGLFLQDEITIDSLSKHKVLLGLRLDYHNIYGWIASPRMAYKWSPHYRFIMRGNFGTGFRIVSVFTEDHAALTGSREVVFENEIRPEKSLNATINTLYKMKLTSSSLITWDASFFYYHFTNKISANYDLDPNKIIYNNTTGYAFSRGISLSAILASQGNFKFNVGITYADVQNVSKDSLGNRISVWQVQSPKWTGNFIISYSIPRLQIKVDLTGTCYGVQRLPIFVDDFRPEFSPTYCLMNLQVAKNINQKFECYAGIKNLLNFRPSNPLMRPNDPFDKTVNDPVSNPNNYTFDTSYNYAPMQGIRFYIGFRLTLNNI